MIRPTRAQKKENLAALRVAMAPALNPRQRGAAFGCCTLLLATFVFVGQSPSAYAGQIRLWSTAIVTGDSIKLCDLAELRGMESSEEEDSLRNIVITEAPQPGGSRIIHHDMVRSALGAKGVNFARVSLSGSAQCEVRKPAVQQQTAKSSTDEIALAAARNNQDATHAAESVSQAGRTLRAVIADNFNKELARYSGRAEVLFDSSDDRLLELTAPPLEFRIRRENNAILGLCALQVEVIKEGKMAQQFPLVVRTALSRNVLTARRAINQGAAVAAADIDLMPVTFTRLDDQGLDDAALVLGQRARRFIPAGTRIELESLEPVPLVLRGQLIALTSEVGGVRVVTTAKAGANGTRGETIRVRGVDDNKVEFDAVVTGPGEARAAGGGQRSADDTKPRLASGAKP
jgi:flagella basal body P-ring formation protein FlgA